MSQIVQAYEIALETRFDLWSEKFALSSILERCLTICKLLKPQDECKWISDELTGFKRNLSHRELEKIVPDYRKVHLLFRNVYGQYVMMTDGIKILHDYTMPQSIYEIESALENGLTIIGGPLIEIVKKNIDDKIQEATVSKLELDKVVGSIRIRTLDYLNATIMELIASNEEELARELAETEIRTKITSDQQTETARLLIYDLETRLRELVSSNDPRIDETYTNKWKRKEKKENLPWRKPINVPLIHYSDFKELRKIIIQNENWTQNFKKYFGREEGIISRLLELDSLRTTIAHSRSISDFDFISLKTLYDQFIQCFEKIK